LRLPDAQQKQVLPRPYDIFFLSNVSCCVVRRAGLRHDLTAASVVCRTVEGTLSRTLLRSDGDDKLPCLRLTTRSLQQSHTPSMPSLQTFPIRRFIPQLLLQLFVVVVLIHLRSVFRLVFPLTFYLTYPFAYAPQFYASHRLILHAEPLTVRNISPHLCLSVYF